MSAEPAANSSTQTMRELFEPARLSLDRAPVLRGVFERFATECADRMRLHCVPPCTFMLNAVTTGNTWDLIEAYEDGICSIFYAPEWDARILIGIDRRFAFSMIEAMFGGDGTEAPYESDRAFSTLETRVMREFLESAARGLEPLLAVVERTTLSFERLEGKLDFSTIGLADAPAVMAQLIAQVYDGGGRMFVIIPQSALVPFRRRLERERSREPAHQDPVWAKQLLAQIGQTTVKLDAVLDGPVLAMKSMTLLSVGQILHLPATPNSLLTLESKGEALFRCKIGQSDGQFTVQIVEAADQRSALLDGVAWGLPSRSGSS